MKTTHIEGEKLRQHLWKSLNKAGLSHHKFAAIINDEDHDEDEKNFIQKFKKQLQRPCKTERQFLLFQKYWDMLHDDPAFKAYQDASKIRLQPIHDDTLDASFYRSMERISKIIDNKVDDHKGLKE